MSKIRFHKWVSEFKVSTLTKCPLNSGLNVGDRVNYTNEFGVEFKNKEVLGFTDSHSLFKHGRCVYLDLDCYWMPQKPDSLKRI